MVTKKSADAKSSISTAIPLLNRTNVRSLCMCLKIIAGKEVGGGLSVNVTYGYVRCDCLVYYLWERPTKENFYLLWTEADNKENYKMKLNDPLCGEDPGFSTRRLRKKYCF